MAAKIYCRTTAKGIQSYYLTEGKENYHLFDSAFHRSNKEFFSQGRFIQEVLNARRHASTSVQKISVRLISLVKYIESEYGICVLQKTANKKQRKRRSSKMLRKSQYSYELAAA